MGRFLMEFLESLFRMAFILGGIWAMFVVSAWLYSSYNINPLFSLIGCLVLLVALTDAIDNC